MYITTRTIMIVYNIDIVSYNFKIRNLMVPVTYIVVRS